MMKYLLPGAVFTVLIMTLSACSATNGKNTGTSAVPAMETDMMESTAMMESSDMMESTAMMESSDMMESASMMDDSVMMNQGNPAPDFEMEDLNGNMVKLSDFKGEKVYLKYWASWCPICLGGLEDINTLSAEDNGFQVLTIVAPGQKGEKNIEDFKKWFSGVDNTENITVLFDKDGAYGMQTGVRGYPTSEYIGSDGVMVQLVPGHADNDSIKAIFDSVY